MNELAKAEQIINCTSCGWDKFCINPPEMTTEEVEAKCAPPKIKEGEDADKALMKGLMDVMLFSGKDKQSRVCPQFAKRLKEDKELVEKIKEMMRS